jgi:hypothetical protein
MDYSSPTMGEVVEMMDTFHHYYYYSLVAADVAAAEVLLVGMVKGGFEAGYLFWTSTPPSHLR